MAVEHEKQLRDDEGGALVAVGEGMIAGNAISVGRGECRDVGIGVIRLVERPRQGGLQSGAIANARWPAMLGQMLVMQGEHNGKVDPDPACHFASARKASRRFFMISRTAFI